MKYQVKYLNARSSEIFSAAHPVGNLHLQPPPTMWPRMGRASGKKIELGTAPKCDIEGGPPSRFKYHLYVVTVKSNASQNSGENERETAEFGASDPPKTRLGRNLFSTKYFRHNFSFSEPRTHTGNRNWLFWIKPNTRNIVASYILYIKFRYSRTLPLDSIDCISSKCK